MRNALPTLLLSLLATACVPERVSIGPGGELAVHDSVYVPSADGTLLLDTRLTDRIAELHPAWVAPDAAGGRVVRFAWSPRGDRLAALVSQTKDYSMRAVVHLLAWPGLESQASWELPVGQPHLPAFGPDGRHLALYFDHGNDRGSLLVLDADHPEVPARTLVEHSSIGFAWSPSGQEIAVLVGSGSKLQEYSLGTLAVVRVADGNVRPITGVLFNPTSSVEWSATTGRIEFLSPTVQLPLAPQAVAELPWAVHEVDPASPAAVPSVSVPADLGDVDVRGVLPYGQDLGRIVAFSRSPGERARYVLVTVKEKLASAWLYQPGESQVYVALHDPVEGDRPSAFSVPSWADDSTWLYRCGDGIRRGRLGEAPRTLRPTPAGSLYRARRLVIAQLDIAIGQVAGLVEFHRKVRGDDPEVGTVRAGREKLGAEGAGTPEERAWSVAILGQCPDRPSARQAIAARLGDDAPTGDGLAVKAYAALALDRLVDGKPYPGGVSPLLEVLRLAELATEPAEGRGEEYSRRAVEWQSRLGR